MSRTSASVVVPGRISDAEGLWYDLDRWPAFVDGFSHVVDRDGEWPRSGRIVWHSRPQGRGRVIERVARYEARVGQTVEVEDEKLSGTQTVAFEAADDGTRVTLRLEYGIKDRNALTPFVDALFIRRAVRDSLQRTLDRFARERRGDEELLPTGTVAP
jgi:hypothetical protein